LPDGVFASQNPNLELFMKNRILTLAVPVLSLFLLVSSTYGIAQRHEPVHFSGVFNDYSPTNASVKGSPWEMHGQWSMDIGEGGTANFLADMTMSGYGTSAGLPDATQGGVNPHTHHLKLSVTGITWDMIGCPTVSPATTTGFQIKGTVNLVTGNGSNALFEPIPPVSTLQVCVTGGSEVPFSNVSLVFGGPATTHFGTQAIHGVVRNVTYDSIGNRGGHR
jgi:hypothetical protein